jgi:hypothetical protein
MNFDLRSNANQYMVGAIGGDIDEGEEEGSPSNGRD